MAQQSAGHTAVDSRTSAGKKRGPGQASPKVGRRRGDALAAAAFLAPNVAAYSLFVVIPAVAGLALAFFEWDLFGSPVFAGAANFAKMLDDRVLWTALINTAQYGVLGIAPTVLGGFALAVLVNAQMRGAMIIRVLYFVPLTMSVAVSSVLWSWLYQPESGMINSLLGLVGLDGPSWLSSTTWALPALTMMIIWLSLPLVIILYLAGLQKVPDSIIEAAMLDGAGSWARTWLIIWPNVRPVTLLVVGIEVLNFLSAPFEVALIMTDGGPLNATMPLSLYIYKVAFERLEIGYANALSMLQTFVILAVVGGIWFLRRRKATRT